MTRIPLAAIEYLRALDWSALRLAALQSRAAGNSAVVVGSLASASPTYRNQRLLASLPRPGPPHFHRELFATIANVGSDPGCPI